MKKSFTFSLIALVVILVLATALRLYKLSEIPAGFFADEASIGLNSYTILTNGTDEYGTPYPFFFRALGEYKGPIGVYTTVPFIAIFGLNEFAVRLSSAFFGVLSIFALYLLVKQLFKHHRHNERIALFAAFFLTISPWHNHFSRVYLEALMPFVFFTTLAVYLFLKAQDNERFLPASMVAFALATYSYFPARIFVPLFGITLFAIFFPFFWNHKRITILSLLILALLLTPLMQHHLNSEGWERWNRVNVFSHFPGDGSNGETALQHITNNYLSHFSMDFLFFKGDIGMTNSPSRRHSVRGMGELYLIQLPFMCLGFLGLFKRKYRTALLILTIWLLIYPLADALTADKNAQATRSIIGVVPFQILSAVGLFLAVEHMSRMQKALYVIGIASIIIILTLAVAHYARLYFVEYPLYSSDWGGWQYGARDIINHFISVEDQYDSLMMAPAFNSPGIFIRFYSQNLEKGCTKCAISQLAEHLTQILDPNNKKREFFANPPSDVGMLPDYLKFETKKTIYYPDNSTAFIFGEVKR